MPSNDSGRSLKLGLSRKPPDSRFDYNKPKVLNNQSIFIQAHYSQIVKYVEFSYSEIALYFIDRLDLRGIPYALPAESMNAVNKLTKRELSPLFDAITLIAI